MPPGSGAGAGYISVLSQSLIKWVLGFARSRTLRVVRADASEGWTFRSQVGCRSRRAGPVVLLVLAGKMLVGWDGQRSRDHASFPSPAISSLPQFPSGSGAETIRRLFQERVLLGCSPHEPRSVSALN